MEAFIQQYGFIAAILGGLIQGELLYVSAMLTVSMGYFDHIRGPLMKDHLFLAEGVVIP